MQVQGSLNYCLQSNCLVNGTAHNNGGREAGFWFLIRFSRSIRLPLERKRCMQRTMHQATYCYHRARWRTIFGMDQKSDVGTRTFESHYCEWHTPPVQTQFPFPFGQKQIG